MLEGIDTMGKLQPIILEGNNLIKMVILTSIIYSHDFCHICYFTLFILYIWTKIEQSWNIVSWLEIKLELNKTTVNVLKFGIVVCHKSQDKQGRPRSSLIRIFSVCFSDKHFVSASPDNQHFNWEEKKKRVWNFRTVSIPTEPVDSLMQLSKIVQ